MSAAAAAMAVMTAACGGREKAAHSSKAGEAGAVQVQLAKAVEERIAEEYEATGTVRARTTSVLSARVMGYIREIRAQAGDSVKAGQVVAVLEAKEVESAVRQAEAARAEARSAVPEVNNAIAAAKAQLELANSTHKRMQPLFDQKSITPQEMDEATARQRMAQANFEMARARRSQLDQKIRQADESVAQAEVTKGYTQVTAPFAGMVIERKAEPGMLASPGMPIVVVEQAGSYRLEAAVEESRLASIRPGMAVRVDVEALGKSVDARVEEIVPALDAGSRTFVVKIGLAGGTLRSGMFGRARFAAGHSQALTVPQAALVEMGQVRKVFVVQGGIARGRLVTTGAANEGRMAILSGLSAGEMVVAPVPAGLLDGGKVEVRQ
ncbi:MAG: efflux RND transporter periplasmic adaptor subunit [Candidatus Solibacter usitatus]|nr:efflux RND transporter periplasmic adaptor subunit [Candidatus Solibacter usitatus]